MTSYTAHTVLSCGLDSVDRHFQGYGFDGPPFCELNYRKAAPGPVALLAELGVSGRERRVVTYRWALAEGLAGEGTL